MESDCVCSKSDSLIMSAVVTTAMNALVCNCSDVWLAQLSLVPCGIFKAFRVGGTMMFSIILGRIPPSTTYAIPSNGGMSQLVHKIGSAVVADAAALVEDKNEGICSAFSGMVMGKISYSKRHWL